MSKMSKRLQIRTFQSQKEPIYRPNSSKKLKIHESRHIMQLILDIKIQAQLEARQVRRLMPEKFKLQKEEKKILSFQKDEEIDLDSRSFEEIIADKKKLDKKQKILIQSVIKDEPRDDDSNLYQELLQNILKRLMKSAQYLKRELKKAKGLNVDEEFVMVNVHVCQYCGKKFPKPCSLGGHVSKLHSEERQERRREMNLEGHRGKLESIGAKRQ